MVGTTGFEPATSWSQTKRSTGLSHAPNRVDNPMYWPRRNEIHAQVLLDALRRHR